jgi:hypothetical protein
LVFKGLVQMESDPSWNVSGYRLLHVISRALEYAEANK